ncbi:hypothetical protein LTR16_002059 [Cryomyces antarcticus]|uniref:SH3 domain-containing protein n=1 Tax=Cryomyces antarcticus TaxID=329879 RepID=A0ABR0KVD0_9PEZI|nr:hypothetical protein LTR39_001362 [Cryomyces antarcticus]KAK5018935.1 hypothetical protein LTR60_001296 [Cryomyces antarcticus]KAK5129594.1 hypothetical protein LTR16_002059 [Cryomyces antarcticus]
MPNTKAVLLLGLIAATAPTSMAQSCVPLTGSTVCPAFSNSSISTDSTLTALFPFLSSVTNTASFDTQAQQAISEQEIASTPGLCGTSGPNALSQIRADFTNCALPANSLSSNCIEGVANEPTDCGYSANLGGLCSYCAASSPNATDSCCINSGSETRCTNVKLPITTTIGTLFPSSTSSSTATSATTTGAVAGGNGAASVNRGLSGGAIAGIVIGSVLGALLLLALVIFGCILLRRRRNSQQGSIFNQPSPTRTGPPMAYNRATSSPEQIAVLPGARVARMAALEGTSSSSERPPSGAGGAYEKSSSEEYDSPESTRAFGVAPPPKRSGSLSSGDLLAGAEDSSSPNSGSGDQYSSPEGMGSGQSERLTFFKDYYSQDEIHPGDRVSTLWAYQPRANDEFELERGDMLKIVGIWDDGWATGVRVSSRAEDWTEGRRPQRDSGMSNGSSNRPESASASGEIKAFPLVCVCLPQHWRKTIEGESTDSTGFSADPPRSP